MNNRLSVRICDDNGNLMYSEDYRVRKIIKQGVVRDSEELVYIDSNYSDGYSAGGYAVGSHKLILVAEYEGLVENETTISVPYQYKRKERDQGLYYLYTLYAEVLKKLGQSGSNITNTLGITLTGFNLPESQSAVSGCSLNNNVPSIHSFKAIRINSYPSPLTELRGFGGSNFFLSNQSFKGKRWLGIIPLENIYDTDYVEGQSWNNPLYNKDIFVLIRQNNAVCPIKYTIVEVE